MARTLRAAPSGRQIGIRFLSGAALPSIKRLQLTGLRTSKLALQPAVDPPARYAPVKTLAILIIILYNDTMQKLNKKHKTTLFDIFHEPIRADVNWENIESLILALGGEISEGSGSRVRVYLNGIRAVFHRPHPQRVTDKGALKSVRRFLMEAGINHVEI